MTDWNDMTDKEKIVAVLTKVCGWKIMADDHYLNPAVDPRYWTPASNLPPILESADACIEHVGKAVEKKDKSGIPQRIWIYSTYSETLEIWDREVWSRFNVAIAKPIARGRGDLAPALAEAAYRMAIEGEEG